MSDEIQRYKTRRNELDQEFSSWRDQLIELSDFITPKKGRFLYGRDSKSNDGRKRFNKIIDGQPGRSAKILAAGMQSGLTSPARDWFKLTLPDRDLAKFGPVKTYLDEATKRMKFVYQASNFYNVTHSTYLELGVFGTGSMMITKNPESNGIRCYPFTIGEYTYDTNHLLRVDTFYRTYKMTTRSMVGQFGLDKVSDPIRSNYEAGKFSDYHDVVHLIQPNEDRKQDSILSTDKPWVEVYFELSSSSDFLSKSGYDSFPIMGPRWDVTGSDVYGISPGMEALGDVKQLMKMKEKTLIAIDKWVDPPLNSPTSLKNEGVNILPGGVNYADQSNPQSQLVVPVYAVRPEIRPITEETIQIKQAIREAFFNDLFLMISGSDRKQITAEEIIRRHEEKLVMLGPVIERIQPEMLRPAIDRTFSLMEEMGLLPEPPRELLDRGELDVEYISPLAQAQKMTGVNGIQQIIGVVGEIVGVEPAVKDKVDFDEVIDQISDMLGTPAGIIRSDDDVNQIRVTRAQQLQQEQQRQQLMDMTEGAKNLADSSLEGDNALNLVMDNLGIDSAGGN